MIVSRFLLDGEKMVGFDIEGHSGYAEAGRDILCAGVSMMTMLVVNTVSEEFGVDCECSSDEEIPLISFRIKKPSPDAEALILGFFKELKALEEEYPSNLKVNKTQV